MFNVPRRYVPSFLTKKDKKKQAKALRRSRRAYKKGNTIQEKKLNHLNQKFHHMLSKQKKCIKLTSETNILKEAVVSAMYTRK